MKHEVELTRAETEWPPPPPDPIRDPDILDGYLEDASRKVGEAEQLFRPTDEKELARVLYHLSQADTAATVVACQTSTTGSSVPAGGALVSMEKLNRLKEVSVSRCTATAEAGILLGAFQTEIEAQGLFYPPDPTSRNESTLGGSVACNASGARTFKYGPTRHYVRRVRVVTADGYLLEATRGQVCADHRGTITLVYPDDEKRALQCPSYALPEVKHAAGYHSEPNLDLIDLFIGSEGTLGVISEVEVALLPKPEKVIGFMAYWRHEARALEFVVRARREHSSAGPEPRCLEWFDIHSLEHVRDKDSSHPPPEEARAAVFFEQECTEDDENARLEQWYDLLSETDALLELEGGVIVADTPARLKLLYEIRHAVPAGVNERAAHNGMPKLGTDLAVPDEALEAMMGAYARAVAQVPETLGLAACIEISRGALRKAPSFGAPAAADHPPEALAELARRLDALAAKPSVDTLQPSATADCSRDLPSDLLAVWDALGLPRRFDSALFGHIGDNHLHLNFLPRNALELNVARRLYDRLTDIAIGLGGTVSAEHGIGKLKKQALVKLLGFRAIEQMRAIKQQLDPVGVLGRGNLFDPVSL